MKPDDDAFAQMEELVNKTADIQRTRQNLRTAEEGEVQMKGVFKCYLNYDQAQRKNVEQDVPPPRLFKQTRDGKKTYPAKLSHKTQVLHLTHVPGQCEPVQGGWRIRTKLSYNEGENENVKQWLLDHYADFYDGKYKGNFPIGEYVNEEGHLAEYKWHKVHEKALMTVKSNDGAETVFRRHVDGKETNPHIVGPYTFMTYYKVSAEQFVTLRKDGEEADAELVPQGFTSFVVKGVQLSEDHDALMPITERLHRLEVKDAHNMIPMDRLRAGENVPVSSVYFWACHKYQSVQPCPTGVTIFKLPPKELGEFISVFGEKTAARHSIGLSVFQWQGDTSTEREMYSVKIVAHENDLWKQYGITDMQHYANILMANYTIPCHVMADLWKKKTIEAEANDPEMLNNKPDLAQMRGVYTYGAKSLVPDYIEYVKRGQAHRISAARVEREFKRFTTTNQETDEKEIHLKPVADAKVNPLNGERPANAPVFALGNGQVEDPNAKKAKPLYHAFDDDMYPLLGDSEFFVLTSYKMNHDELQLVQDPKRGDDFLDELIEKHKVFYWMFGIRKKYLSAQAPLPPPPAGAGAKSVPTEGNKVSAKKRSTAKEDDAEDVEADQSSVAMEAETPKKKKGGNAKKK